MSAGTQIEEIVEPTLQGLGYDLVRVQISGGDRQTLQIMAERRDGAGLSVDDCAEISNAVSTLLDVEEPIPGAYTLEISSPGIDRPLTRPKDFERFAGFEAKLELRNVVGGRRRYRGRIVGLAKDGVHLATVDGEITLPVDCIQRAKLLMTDELLAAAAKE